MVIEGCDSLEGEERIEWERMGDASRMGMGQQTEKDMEAIQKGVEGVADPVTIRHTKRAKRPPLKLQSPVHTIEQTSLLPNQPAEHVEAT